MPAALEIVHQDERILVAAKPAGVLVVPGRGEDGGRPLAASVQAHLGRKPFVVHRLDRETSGLVVFALDADAHRILCAQFEARTVKKRYLAVVHGTLENQGSVDRPLRRFGSGRIGVDPYGRKALTRYRPFERNEKATLLHAFPETGRTHQIRVHLFSIGHPIIGDKLYFKGKPDEAPRMLLHAERLEFNGLNGKPIFFKTPPPADFLDAAQAILGPLGRLD